MTAIRSRLTFALILAVAPLQAQMQTRTDRLEQVLSLDSAGSVTVENPIGSITITGSRSTGVAISAVRAVSGVDQAAIKEGQNQTTVQWTGDARHRHIRTLVPFPPSSNRWESQVSYSIQVPATASVMVVNHSGATLRVENLSGELRIKHVNGAIELTNVTGGINVDTGNGTVRLRYLTTPKANAYVNSINGPVELSVPEDSSFVWQATTLRGEIYNSLPIRGLFLPAVGKSYRARVGSANTVSIRTTSVTGDVFLLGSGHLRDQAKPIQSPKSTQVGTGFSPSMSGQSPVRIHSPFLIRPVSAKTFVLQLQRVTGNYSFETNLGSLFLGESTGNVQLITRAGEIVVGRVMGSCVATSGGGQLNLGNIIGSLNARTTAGDILVNAARKGGTVTTEAGNIQVVYTGARISLFSGGGDISLRDAAGPVNAESRSGDITINMNPQAGSQSVDAKSVGGNIVLNLAPGFNADIEAVATVPLGEPNPILSEFAGLEISTERVGNQIRARAVGRINGGGPRVILNADNGIIHIRSRILPPTPLASTR